MEMTDAYAISFGVFRFIEYFSLFYFILVQAYFILVQETFETSAQNQSVG